MDVLHPLHLLCESCILGNDGAPRHHVVTLVILCQTLDDHVCAMVQGAQDHRRCEGGVDDMVSTMCLGDLGNLVEVGECQHRIGGSFAKDQFGVGLHCLAHDFGVGEITERKLH